MKRTLLRKEEDNDPMSVVSNLFDVAMVFAVALMVALVTRYNMTEMLSQEDFTMVKNPGKENMEIITKDGEKIKRVFRRIPLDNRPGARFYKYLQALPRFPPDITKRIPDHILLPQESDIHERHSTRHETKKKHIPGETKMRLALQIQRD